MRRHCGRPGCNAVATATFSFDATRCVVWLNLIEDGMPRAGDLCTRHADGMAPPKGWERVDHRTESMANVAAEPVSVVSEPALVAADSRGAGSGTVDDLLPHKAPTKRKRKAATPKKRWDEVPSLFNGAADTEPAASSEAGSTAVAVEHSAPALPQVPDPQVPDPNGWMPRFATDDDLGGVLDASTPLLSRAFNNARPVEATDADTRDVDSPHDR